VGDAAMAGTGATMRALVTGGGGFLGGRITELLLARGDDVWILARRRYPAIEARGARSLVADLRDPEAVRRAVVPVDVVFHVAAKVGHWGPQPAFQAVNVDGTRHVLEAARDAGTPRLVFTSTPSVVGYAEEVEGGGPDLPFASRHESGYSETKARAEQLVVSEDSPSFRTVVLRPHLVFGPGDPHLLPRLVERARQGALRRVGNGRNRVDLTYIDNAAWAHLDAAAALARPEPPCAGHAYFISNGEPVVLWDWVDRLLRELGIPPVRSAVSLPVARLVARGLEAAWQVGRLPGEPPVTRLVAGALARSHWYDMGPAARDLGYRPRVPMDEATRRTVGWLRSRR
jgi:nucleoside-diphosphate-sugar epimerase